MTSLSWLSGNISSHRERGSRINERRSNGSESWYFESSLFRELTAASVTFPSCNYNGDFVDLLGSNDGTDIILKVWPIDDSSLLILLRLC